MTFHVPDSYYEPPDEQECNCLSDPCTCEQDAQDAHEDYLIDQEQMRREDEALNGPDPRWEP